MSHQPVLPADRDIYYLKDGFRFKVSRMHTILQNGTGDVNWHKMSPKEKAAFKAILTKLEPNGTWEPTVDDVYIQDGFKFYKSRVREVLKNGGIDVKWENMPPTAKAAFKALMTKLDPKGTWEPNVYDFYEEGGYSFYITRIHEILENGTGDVKWENMTPEHRAALEALLNRFRIE